MRECSIAVQTITLFFTIKAPSMKAFSAWERYLGVVLFVCIELAEGCHLVADRPTETTLREPLGVDLLTVDLPL